MKDAHAVDRHDLKPRTLTLALLREQRGLTQAKLARRAKITQSEVSRTEQREDCLVSTLERYATALGGELLLHVKIDGHLYPVTL
jgi:transcriptional regulator with XRE-family HTH domain